MAKNTTSTRPQYLSIYLSIHKYTHAHKHTSANKIKINLKKHIPKKNLCEAEPSDTFVLCAFFLDLQYNFINFLTGLILQISEERHAK